MKWVVQPLTLAAALQGAVLKVMTDWIAPLQIWGAVTTKTLAVLVKGLRDAIVVAHQLHRRQHRCLVGHVRSPVVLDVELFVPMMVTAAVGAVPGGNAAVEVEGIVRPTCDRAHFSFLLSMAYDSIQD